MTKGVIMALLYTAIQDDQGYQFMSLVGTNSKPAFKATLAQFKEWLNTDGRQLGYTSSEVKQVCKRCQIRELYLQDNFTPETEPEFQADLGLGFHLVIISR